MSDFELKASKRTLLGKQVRTLRRSGIVPAHLYGRGLDSVSLQVEAAVVEKILTRGGASHLVTLVVDGDTEAHNVLLKELQRDYLDDKLIHVDLFQVNMAEKIRVTVPVVLTGEAPAIRAKLGILMHNMRSVDVECLPGRMPSVIEVDLSGLVNLDDGVHVGDLQLGEGVRVVSDPGDLIVKVGQVRVAKEEAPKPAEAKVEEAAEGAELAEGAAPAEGAAKAGKGEEKKGG